MITFNYTLNLQILPFLRAAADTGDTSSTASDAAVGCPLFIIPCRGISVLNGVLGGLPAVTTLRWCLVQVVLVWIGVQQLELLKS